MAAKKKLYGAALAAHNRKIGHRATSTALVRRRRPSTALAAKPKTKTKTVYVKTKRRHTGGGGGGGVGPGVNGAIATLKHDAWDYAGAGGYGYLTRNDSLTAVEWRKKTLDKLPTSAKLGRPLSHGLLMLFGAALLPRGGGLMGYLRKGLGHLSHAALMRAADNYGAAGGDHDAFAAMAGDEGGADYSGAIDADAEER